MTRFFSSSLHSEQFQEGEGEEEEEEEDVGSGEKAVAAPVVTKKEKRSRPRFKPRKIPVCTREDAEFLFDRIAPHIPRKQMRSLVSQLKKKGKHSTRINTRIQTLWKTKEALPETIRRQVIHLLVGGKEEEHDDPNFAPRVNRREYNVHLDVLHKARELVVRNPLLWSRKEKVQMRKEFQKQQSGSGISMETVMANRAAKLSEMHHAKPQEVLQQETEDMAQWLADHLPAQAHHKWMKLLQDNVELCHPTPTTTNRRMRLLLPNLYNATTFHVHLVAEHVASFFYVDMPRVEPEDSKIREAKQDWEGWRTSFGDAFLGFQASLIEAQQQQQAAETKRKEDDIVDTLKLEIGQQQQDDDNHGANGTSEDSAEKTTKKKKRVVHVCMEAIERLVIHSDDEVASDKMVFVNNLPIDVTEMELDELYSRCGPLRSIRIYNQRPELDPGPLSNKQLRQRKSGGRRNHNNNNYNKRTPVYALLTFATQEAQKLALDPNLRLFGMIVRKHAVRSCRPQDFTSLYLQNLPDGLHSYDLEYVVAKLFQPRLFVSFPKAEQQMQHNVTSLEIMFPSFELAIQHYDALEQGMQKNWSDTASLSTLNWMRTPSNAMLYWTREIGFD